MSTTDVGTTDRSLPADESERRQTPRPHATHRHVVWGVTGFVLGVVVWHFVGFWSLVSTILFHGPEPTVLSAEDQRERAALIAARKSWAKQTAPSAPLSTGSISTGDSTSGPAARPSATACAALVLDRTAQSTSLAACMPEPQAQPAADAAERGNDSTAALRTDRLATATPADSTWSVVVDTAQPESAVTSVD